MKRLYESERSIFLVAVPLMTGVTLVLTWLFPLSMASRLAITAFTLAGAAYAGVGYWLRTRKRWRGLRYTTPLFLIGIITGGLISVGAQAPLGFLLYFPAVVLSSIRSGRNIGVGAAALATLGYYLADTIHQPYPLGVYNLIYVGMNLFIVAALSGAIVDDERRQRRQAQEQRVREQAALLKLADALTNAADRNATLNAAVKTAAQILSVEAVTIVMPEGERYVVQIGWGMMAAVTGRDLQAETASISINAIVHGQPIAVNDFRVERRFPSGPSEHERNLRAGLAVPMMREGCARGAFVIYALTPRVFSEDEVHLLSLIANQTLVAIERKHAEDRLRREAARAEALARVAARLNAQLDLDTVLHAICEETTQALHMPVATIRLYDDKRDALNFAYGVGVPPEFGQRARPIPRALFETYAQRVNPISVIQDVQAHPDLPNGERYAELNIRTLLSASLLRQGQLVGQLNVGSVANIHPISDDELDLLRGLADQAAQAITNARLFAQAQRRLEHLQLLRAIDLAITASLDLDVTLHVFLERITSQLEIDAAAVLLFNPRTALLEYAAGRGFRSDVVTSSKVRLGEGRAGRAALERRTLSLSNAAEIPASSVRTGLLSEEGFVTYHAMPLIAKQQLKGVLEIFHRAPLDSDPEWLELLETLAGQAAIAIENAALFESEREQRGLAEALRDTAAALNSTLNFEEVLERILTNAGHVVPHDSASILLIEGNTAHVVRRRGYIERGLETSVLALRLPVANVPTLRKMAQTGQPIVIPDTQADPGWVSFAETNWVRSYASAPIRLKGQVIGFLNLNSATPGFFSLAQAERLQAFADQAGIAIENARLFDDLQHTNAELVRAYDTTLEGWSRALDLRDRETEGHTQRVTEMTLRLARAMHMPEADLVHVRRGALLHDIGKMGIPDSILFKPGPLTDDEKAIMRLHPGYAYQMLAPIGFLRPALVIPYCHHEKWDGTGYPRGLKGEAIPLAARIFAVADVWDALCSDRPYRQSWSEERVNEHIYSLAGTHFDPQIVEVFMSLEGRPLREPG